MNKLKLLTSILASVITTSVLTSCNNGAVDKNLNHQQNITLTPSLKISGDDVADASMFATLPLITYEYTTQSKETMKSFCSGVLVKGKEHDFIVTALHCLNKRDIYPGTNKDIEWMIHNYDVILPNNKQIWQATNDHYYFMTSNNYDPTLMINDGYKDKTKIHSADVFYLPPPDPKTHIHPDIAIVQLKNRVGNTDIPEVKIESYDTSISNLSVFGWADNYDADQPKDFGILRQGTINQLDRYELKNSNELYIDYYQSNILASPGDSGGPLIQWHNKKATLYGVTSMSDNYTGRAIHQTINASTKEWLNNVIYKNNMVPYSSSCNINSICKLRSQPYSK